LGAADSALRRPRVAPPFRPAHSVPLPKAKLSALADITYHQIAGQEMGEAMCHLLLRLTAAWGVVVFLVACSTSYDSGANQPTSQAAQRPQFADLALPADYSLDDDHTLVIGTGPRWVGRLVLTTAVAPDSAFNFFREGMPKFGWKEEAVASGQSMLITFSSPATARVAIVQISRRTLAGSHVEILISTASQDDTPPSSERSSARLTGARQQHPKE